MAIFKNKRTHEYIMTTDENEIKRLRMSGEYVEKLDL